MKIKRLFELAGCKDSEDEIYSPHSFRTFADSQMSKAGLDRKYVALIIGHKSKLAAESHYADWGEIESRWVETCEQKMTWLSETITVTVPDPKLQSQIDQLKQAFVFQIAYGNAPYNSRLLRKLGISEDEVRLAIEQAEQLELEDESESGEQKSRLSKS